jgi:hypothetical protein
MNAMLTTGMALLLVMGAAEAQTVKVWKWVDRDGRITYSEEPPAAGTAVRVEEKMLNPDEITVQTTPAPASEPVTAEITPSVPATETSAEAAAQAAARERLLWGAGAEAEAREQEAASGR